MRALAGDLLLTAWDRCAREHDLNRALIMLSIALPQSSCEELAELSIGERNVLLLRLHQMSFGPHLRGFAACARCGAPLEFAVNATALAARLEAQAAPGAGECSDESRRYQMRPVNSRDLIASLDFADTEEAQEKVLAGCLSAAEGADAAELRTLPAVLAAFERVNAAAELSCTIECPGCANVESRDLDIARFLWLEARHAARRLFEEVHALAAAYGWSERAIVRMSPQRRGAYLEMLGA